MNARSSPATSVEHGPIESVVRHPGVRPLTLTDLINCVRSDSPGMREHAVKIAYALGARDGQAKANEVLEGVVSEKGPDDLVLAAFFGFLAGGLGVAILMAWFTTDDSNWQPLAVDHCGAYYHPHTGKFTWKDCPRGADGTIQQATP